MSYCREPDMTDKPIDEQVLTKSVLLKNETEHSALASKVAGLLASNDDGAFIMFLQGDLGTGKTTFARGFIHGCGFDGTVRSPTYTLVEPYPIYGGRTCYHFDLYRLSDPEELEFTGARDYFNDRDVCLVEWPEKAAAYLPEADWICRFRYLPEGRKLEIIATGDRGIRLLLQALPDE